MVSTRMKKILRIEEIVKMYKILELRERYKEIYAGYSMYIDAAFKFIIALVGMIVINSNIGAMGVLNNPLVVIIISLVCALLPKTLSVMVLMLTIVAHAASIAVEAGALVLVMFILMYLLFFRFTSKESLVLILLPILFAVKIPYILPIIMGLVGTPVSIVSVSFGTLVYFVLSFVGNNYDEVIKVGADDGFAVLKMFFQGVLQEKAFYFCIIVFAVVVILVYAIKRLSIDYSWIIAVISAGVFEVIAFLVANVVIDMRLVSGIAATIIGGLLSVGIAWFLQFFLHSVDYTKTSKVQFEDDDYYYYVKAVPKIKVAAPDVRVKRVKAKR